MPIIFGMETAGIRDELYKILQSATLKRDENAPIYATVDEVKNLLEERNDIREMKRKYDEIRECKGSGHYDSKRARNTYLHLEKELKKLLVQEKREVLQRGG
ncbi:hypothetical protein B0T24DRAFT_625115 [Lasiosphaeria ovina]|uniref:Uncharacterized protein n=1 Tax=Lasiosphaeria ovina TaxID=92902 RepID=A0AAE0KDG1_9PEZI|nr:hypothetical protein B0T24DRAFT_625115 [Lasiosphaeria ovina]